MVSKEAKDGKHLVNRKYNMLVISKLLIIKKLLPG